MINISYSLVFKHKALQKLVLNGYSQSHFSTSQQNGQDYEKELGQFTDYKEAFSLIEHKQYLQANERFSRVIEILESSHQTANPIFAHLIQQASKNVVKLKDYKAISKLMKKGFDGQQDKNSELARKYSINFILSTVQFDLSNAYKHLDSIQNSHEYPFLKGSLQILKGESNDAIQSLQQYIDKNQANPLDSLLWRAYNNLGVANWQNEYPKFNHFNVMNDVVKKNEPSVQTALLFKQALLLNNQNMKGNKVYDQIAESPDIIPKEQIARIDFYFDQAGSDISLRCLSDYLLDGHHKKRYEHTLWTKFFLKHHEFNNRTTLYRPIISIAHHCQVSEMPLKSEGLFNTAITMLADNQTIEKALCEYYLAQMIGKIDKREEESENLKIAARESYKQFPEWHHWMLYVAMPNLEF